MIITVPHAPILRPYQNAIKDNLSKLMSDCGFNNDVICILDMGCPGDIYGISIRFPRRLTNSSSSTARLTLEIEDGIASHMGEAFNKLLTAGDAAPQASESGSETPSGSSESSNKRSRHSTSTLRSESPPSTRSGQGNRRSSRRGRGRGRSRGRGRT
jgi:hypothetical protein